MHKYKLQPSRPIINSTLLQYYSTIVEVIFTDAHKAIVKENKMNPTTF